QQVIDRYAVLRTAFAWEKADSPLQVVGKYVRLKIDRRDWRDLSLDEQQKQLASYLELDSRRGFKLSKAPLMRLALIQIAEDCYKLIWSYHHLLLDGWSLGLLLHTLFSLYEGLCQGHEVSLAPSRPYHDYIDWLQTQNLAAAASFWRDTLRGFTS